MLTKNDYDIPELYKLLKSNITSEIKNDSISQPKASHDTKSLDGGSV